MSTTTGPRLCVATSAQDGVEECIGLLGREIVDHLLAVRRMGPAATEEHLDGEFQALVSDGGLVLRGRHLAAHSTTPSAEECLATA